MINLNKNTVNKVYLDLYNVSTINPAYYLFKFTNTSKETKLFYCPDTSTSPSAYNLFDIQETSSEDLNNGKVSLSRGSWEYQVYQSATSSLIMTYSVTAFNGKDFIASGRVWVYDSTQ